MLTTWEDVSSYRRGDTERIPSILETEICGFSLFIHRHIHYPGTWLLSCYGLNLTNVDLSTDDFNEAERNAVAFLVAQLDKYVELQDALKALIPSDL